MRPQLLSSGKYDYMYHLYSKGYMLKHRAWADAGQSQNNSPGQRSIAGAQ